jgi:hypothetical protein
MSPYRQRVLLLDEKTEASILMICDVALRFSGMHMASVVSDIALAIRDQKIMDREEDW